MIVTKRFDLVTSKQVTDHVFCSTCEDHFNRNGEKWLAANGCRQPGEFLVRDALLSCTPMGIVSNARLVSAAAIPALDVPKIVYFATSVFWRAAVHTWRLDEHTLEPISFGLYEDQFRRYLLGELDFPEHAAIWVHVSPAVEPQVGLIAPFRKNKSTYSQFHFSITGMAFDLFVGRMVPEAIRQTCLCRSIEKVMFLSDLVDRSFVDSMIRIKGGSGLPGFPCSR